MTLSYEPSRQQLNPTLHYCFHMNIHVLFRLRILPDPFTSWTAWTCSAICTDTTAVPANITRKSHLEPANCLLGTTTASRLVEETDMTASTVPQVVVFDISNQILQHDTCLIAMHGLINISRSLSVFEHSDLSLTNGHSSVRKEGLIEKILRHSLAHNNQYLDPSFQDYKRRSSYN